MNYKFNFIGYRKKSSNVVLIENIAYKYMEELILLAYLWRCEWQHLPVMHHENPIWR